MKNILSVENMRKSDAYTIEHSVSGKVLMKRAGEAVFNSISWKAPAAVVCGSGNNAGDGYVIAGCLKEAGISCRIFLLSDRFSEDGKYYYDICRNSGIESVMWNGEDFSEYNTIADCLLGTGFKGEVTGIVKDVIEKMNNSGAYIVSVDINSGLNGDSGMASVCVRSDITVSIGSYKPGHFLNMAKDVMKTKINCDIGIEPFYKPFCLTEEEDVKKLFVPRLHFSHKGTYGYIALIGGSKKYCGAVQLAYMANAAMRSGAGVVKVAVPSSLRQDVIKNILESTVFTLSDSDGEMIFDEEEFCELISNVKTVAFGMGSGVTEETSKAVEYLLRNFKGKLIIDADGLTVLSRLDRELIRNSRAAIILTPHLKEFSVLSGLGMEKIKESPIQTACDYAKDTGTVLLLKGSSTVITDGENVFISDTGCPGMATAGSGDVLSGILAAVCAYIPDTLMAVTAGAYINGRAGELAQKKRNPISMIASDTVECIPEIISSII